MTYTLSEISQITNSELYGNADRIINYVVFDSRRILPSLNSLFFSIKTKQNDGHKYIADLYKKGLKNFVVEEGFAGKDKFPDANFIFVKNSVVALQKLAAYHRQLFDIPIVAITGSNGKTIVKEWLTAIISPTKKVLQSPKSYNSQIGVSLSVLELKKQHEIAIFEAGISKVDEMIKLEKIIKPKIGIFTNIGDAHQENFDSIQTKINEKIILYKDCDTIIYNFDNELITYSMKKKYPNGKFFTWGRNEKSDLRILEIKQNVNSSEIDLFLNNKNYQIKVGFIDSASLENIFSTLSAALVLFPDANPNSFDFSKLHSVEMRLQQLEGINNCTIINDSYNCDLASLRIALNVLNAQNQHTQKTVILSDIFEVGTDEKKLYSKVAKLLKISKINRVIGIGNRISKFADYFENIKKDFFKETNDFINNTHKFSFRNEAILIKGARRFHFEKISNSLQLKNHRTVLEINLSAFENNLNYYKRLLNPQTKLMIMVKAFSYGSGTYEIANLLQLKGVDYLAVAIADEGIMLRKAGITTPILVLNPDIERLDALLDYSLEPEIYNFRILDYFYNTVKNKTSNPYPIHIKLNTGMNRLGFSENQIDELLQKLQNYDDIFVKSVFSHCVGADDAKFDDFTKQQISSFVRSANKIRQNIEYDFIRHILNSAGIERFSDYQFDMVRLGIGLYGVGVLPNSPLKNISRLKTKIVQIIEVQAGETVGYSRMGKINNKSVIATLPIGYADGLNRKLSNGVGLVKIKNKLAPIVGNICMDLTMIDITGISAKEGDEVIIFDEEHSVSKLADSLQTIPYEILTSISQRVKRVYVWE